MTLHTILIIFLAIMSSSCNYSVDHLKLSTTTSTDNSGLLAVLHPAFEAKYNVHVDVIAAGTGKALNIGSRGDVDVVFVHAPEAELKYVEQGDFIDRKAVMHNDFVIVGAKEDKAELKRATSAIDALQRIAQTGSFFISRGDDSGTHKKEMSLWQQVGIKPEGEWYIQAGQGMGAVLKIADEKQAYVLTDRGTHIAFTDKVSLVVAFEGDEALFNPYHVMAVNPEKHQYVNYALAKKYIDFVTGSEGQQIIKHFRKAGRPLFYPDADLSLTE